MVEEVSGVMRGALTLLGNSPAISASCSASVWRARNTSVPSLNTAVMTDKPSMDSERSDSMSPKPLTVDSMGSVTSSSTCSAFMPTKLPAPAFSRRKKRKSSRTIAGPATPPNYLSSARPRSVC